MSTPDDSCKSGSLFDSLNQRIPEPPASLQFASEPKLQEQIEAELEDIDFLHGLRWTAGIHLALAMTNLCLEHPAGAVFWLMMGLLSLYVRAARKLITTTGIFNLLIGLAGFAISIAMIGDAIKGHFFSRMPHLIGPILFLLVPLSSIACLYNAHRLLTFYARLERARRLIHERTSETRQPLR